MATQLFRKEATMSSNQTPFQAVMLEVLEHGQKAEALGFKVLSNMIDMETTFHVGWLQDYFIHKNTHGYQATKIREVLSELLGEVYTAIVEDSQIKATDTKTDPQLGLKKQLAQKKRINLDNRVRSCIEAMVFFRINPLNSKGLVVNNLNKTVSFTTKAGDSYRNLTFTDVQDMSKRVAAEQGWIPKPKEKESDAGTVVASDGKPVQAPSLPKVEENASKLFEATVRATQELIHRTEMVGLSDQGVKNLVWLAKTCMKKLYADSKGKIKLEDLALDFSGMFIGNDGKTISLADSKAEISTNPENRQEAA